MAKAQELSPYEVEMAYWAEFVERQNAGRLLVRRDEAIRELSSMGYVNWYLHPQVRPETALHDWYVFEEEILRATGCHRHQGGPVLFVLEGRGWTELDGVQHHWEAGDLIIIPFRVGGVAHQHFNADPSQPARLVAFVSIAVLTQAGTEMVQEIDYGDTEGVRSEAPEAARDQATTGLTAATKGAGSLFDELLRLRDDQRKAWAAGRCVIKASELPLEENGHGRMRWYMHPSIRDTAAASLLFYVQEIAAGQRSGRQHHPGGLVFFVWEGQGRTEIDGIVHDWSPGDLLQVPHRTDGSVFQHFNTGDELARIVAVEENFVHSLGVDRGSGFEQLTDASN
jgi:gentisate 1,2-dioxygenase